MWAWLSRVRAPFAYYGRVLLRALRDTWRHVVAYVLVALVLALLAAARECDLNPPGLACVMSQSLRAALWAFGVYGAAVLAFNLLLAPVRMERETVGLRVAGEPLPVEYLSHVVHREPMFAEDNWEFEAYQTAAGIGLSWRAGDPSDFGMGAPKQVPGEVVCRITSSAGGKPHELALKRGWQGRQVECVYPRDFPTAEPTTGSIEAEWLVQRNDTRFIAVPPLEVLRGQRERTAQEVAAEKAAGEQLVTCATLSVKLSVRRGSQLL
jgi:hypothetical protein